MTTKLWVTENNKRPLNKNLKIGKKFQLGNYSIKQLNVGKNAIFLIYPKYCIISTEHIHNRIYKNK